MQEPVAHVHRRDYETIDNGRNQGVQLESSPGSACLECKGGCTARSWTRTHAVCIRSNLAHT